MSNSGDMQLSIELTANNGKLVGVVRSSEKAIDSLGDHALTASTKLNKASKSTQTLGLYGEKLTGKSTKAARSVDRLGKSGANAARKLDKTRRSTDRLGRSFSKMARFGVAAIAIMGARELAQMADRWNTLQQRIKTATRETGDYNQVAQQLFTISQANGVAMESTVSLFQNLARTAPDLGVTNAEVLKLTQSVQQLGVIGGSTQTQMDNALMQFGQAMAGGVMRAEEFNSIVENTPEIAARIAKGMGMTVGQLRLAVNEGSVLSEDVFNSLLGQSDEISQQFDEIPISLDRSTTMLGNSLVDMLGQLNQSWGVTSSIAELFQDISKSIDETDWGAVARFMAPRIIPEKVEPTAPKVITPQEQARADFDMWMNLQQQLSASGEAWTAEMAQQLALAATRLNEFTVAEEPAPVAEQPAAALGSSLDKKDWERRQKSLQKEMLNTLPLYEQLRQKADAWRDAQMEGLDQSALGYTQFADEVETVYQSMLEKAVTAEQQAIDERMQASTHWKDHAILALQGYESNALDIAESVGDAFTRNMQGMEDALVEFVKTGKLDFSSLADSIISDLIRIQVRQSITAPLSGMLNTFVSGMFGGGGGEVWSEENLMMVPANHTGGIVGMEGSSRVVSPSVFANAPRFHTGGIAGYEVPTILKRGEGVFTEGQMKALGARGTQNLKVEIINKGTPQQVQNADLRLDLKGEVVRIVLDDQRRDGPITKGYNNLYGGRRPF